MDAKDIASAIDVGCRAIEDGDVCWVTTRRRGAGNQDTGSKDGIDERTKVSAQQMISSTQSARKVLLKTATAALRRARGSYNCLHALAVLNDLGVTSARL